MKYPFTLIFILGFISSFCLASESEINRQELVDNSLKQFRVEFSETNLESLKQKSLAMTETEFHNFLEVFERFSETQNNPAFQENPTLAWELSLMSKGFGVTSDFYKIRPIPIHAFPTKQPKLLPTTTLQKHLGNISTPKHLHALLLHCLSIKKSSENQTLNSDQSEPLRDQYKTILKNIMLLSTNKLTQEIATELLMSEI